MFNFFNILAKIRAHCIAPGICGHALSCWKSTSPSCRRNISVAPGQCSMHCLLHPAETPDVTASCSWWPPTPWSLRWGLCVVGECTSEDDAQQIYTVHVYVYYLHTDRTYSHRCVLRSFWSTAVGQVVACAPVTQRARVRSPVGTSFLGEVFSGFFLTCKKNVGKL